ncbi:hypothetical protein H4R18_003705 [Coemansia javaensis]|uniref:Uncharacterized protein n=1 Tax=Coemansia javaensis TaxID=2761396 RepID=A0A9W8HB61_9FUNG|nr:hypothetical protein H4R18_003705 [Coemansia javaensis]
MDHSVAAFPKMLWATACSAWRWAATGGPDGSRSDPQPPPQYPGLAYGFLQGTLGLAHGGYLVPMRRPLRSTLTLADSAPLFGAVGTRAQIADCLRAMPTMVFCKLAARTCTSDLVIEMYRARSALSLVDELCARAAEARGLCGWLALLAGCCWRRLAGRLFSRERQLVIRSEHTAAPVEAPALLRIRAPQGIMLSEIAALIDGAAQDRADIDVSRDKALNIRIMGRSRSASLLDDADDDGSANDGEPAFLLPPYQPVQTDLPPAYSLHA